MESATVGQASMLAEEFQKLLNRYVPGSVAVVGCAGGNGFDSVVDAGVTRLVGIDINERYVADARKRYASAVAGLELYCADIQNEILALQPVDLVYAALVFEYVDVAAALRSISRMCRPNGLLAVVLQLPKQGVEAVTSSPFESLKKLKSIMRLVPPEELARSAQAEGFDGLSHETITLASGKQFAHLLFRLSA